MASYIAGKFWKVFLAGDVAGFRTTKIQEKKISKTGLIPREHCIRLGPQIYDKHLYFCISKASKLEIRLRPSGQLAGVPATTMSNIR